MSAENYKNPKDFEIPRSHRPVTPGELWKASEDPELRPMIRFFSDQVQDVMSAYMKGDETPEEKAFLIQCRKDSRAFRKVLQQKILAAAERYKGDERVNFVLERLACTNRSAAPEDGEGEYLFSVEIRPLFFSTLLDEEERDGKRYPQMEGRYTVFLHVDQRHRFQMTRFMEPDEVGPGYRYLMERLLAVFSAGNIKPLLEQHYGDWETLSEKIVEQMVEDLRGIE